MKSARLIKFAGVVTVTMLFQSAVFAVEHPNADALEVATHTSGPGAKHRDCSHATYDSSGQAEGTLERGLSLPVLDIQTGGEVSLSDNSIIESPWSSKTFEGKGRVQLVQYISANRAAVRQNKLFTQAMIDKQFSSDLLDTTIIVHMADTVSFAKGIVVNKIAKNKVKHKHVNFVIDHEGVGLERWGMKHKSFAVIVLDASGKVLFAKDGPLSDVEIESTIKLIEQQMG